MPEFDDWQIIRPLDDGEGGQGKVFLARSPERAAKRTKTKESLRYRLTASGMTPSLEHVESMMESIQEFNRPDEPSELGALKQFKIPPGDPAEVNRAVGRLESEVRALNAINQPAVLKLLHANVDERFIVTEFHEGGPLHKKLGLFKGDSLAALKAFGQLVDGVIEIHKQGAVHRDIKPANIFVASSGDLVLGDFGIVFLQKGSGTRLTKTIGELVGSHWWMPPWAYTYDQIAFAKINDSFDIYPLAKVLWSMISGRNGFLREEYNRPENNLAALFPDDPSMALVNQLLAKCIVRDEPDCLTSAAILHAEVDSLIAQIEAQRAGRRPAGADAWPCRMCERGVYRAPVSLQGSGRPATRHVVANLTGAVQNNAPGVQDDREYLAAFVCDKCGHAELFRL